jgi:hypothetical protein
VESEPCTPAQAGGSFSVLSALNIFTPRTLRNAVEQEFFKRSFSRRSLSLYVFAVDLGIMFLPAFASRT